MSFKKRETNQNKIRHPGRKRKIIATISLSLSLLFGRGQVNSSQSPNSNFYKQTIERNINLFEDNDQQVILVRNNSSSPTVRPGLANGFSSHPRVNPPAGASGLKPVRANPVRGFSTPHGLITRPPITGAHRQPTRLEGAGNPAGAGGGASSDDQCPIPENQKSQESKTSEYYSRSKKKKKPEAEQCKLEDEFKKDKKYGGFEYKIDKNGNPILRVETKTGSEALFTYDQSLEKYYHEDVYNLKKPKGYDAEHAKSLNRKDRIEYLKKTVPREYVIEYQIANAKSLSTENFLEVPGFISAKKESGTLYINKETRQVHFVNERTNIWRTTVIKSRTGLIKLAKNGFHLFPNAGKK
jgi:hypothetical protein